MAKKTKQTPPLLTMSREIRAMADKGRWMRVESYTLRRWAEALEVFLNSPFIALPTPRGMTTDELMRVQGFTDQPRCETCACPIERVGRTWKHLGVSEHGDIDEMFGHKPSVAFSRAKEGKKRR